MDQEAEDSSDELLRDTEQLEADNDDNDDNDDNLQSMIDDNEQDVDARDLAALQRAQDDEAELGQLAQLLKPKKDMLADDEGDAGTREGGLPA